MEGYIAAKVMAEGLNRAGPKATRESLIAGLDSLGRQTLGSFKIRLSPTEHVASAIVELSMLKGTAACAPESIQLARLTSCRLVALKTCAPFRQLVRAPDRLDAAWTITRSNAQPRLPPPRARDARTASED